MADMLDDLKARVEATRVSADAARAEAARQTEAIKQLHLDAQRKSEAAGHAAEELLVELHRRSIVQAQEESDRLKIISDTETKAYDAHLAVASAQAKKAEAAQLAYREASAKVATLKSNAKPAGNFVRVEGGGFAEVVSPYGPRDAQVTGTNGQIFDHVSDHPSGAWIYRGRPVR